MVLVQRGNKQLRVDELMLENMLKDGYKEIDEKTGKPLKPTEENECAALKKENAALKKENKSLKAKLEELLKPPIEGKEKN